MCAERTASDGYRIELTLYMSSASPASLEARRSIERLLDGFVQSQVKWVVCDLARDLNAGAADRITYTPTLVKRFPEPRVWIVGSMKETDIIVDLLRSSGVDSRK